MKPTKRQLEILRLLQQGFCFRSFTLRTEWLEKFGVKQAILVNRATKELMIERGWIGLVVEHSRQRYSITDKGRKLLYIYD